MVGAVVGVEYEEAFPRERAERSGVGGVLVVGGSVFWTVRGFKGGKVVTYFGCSNGVASSFKDDRGGGGNGGE